MIDRERAREVVAAAFAAYFSDRFAKRLAEKAIAAIETARSIDQPKLTAPWRARLRVESASWCATRHRSTAGSRRWRRAE
ncbi:MAG: hypothetical protein H6721_24065 [Sandaracinus sp.]|nr:hypothetical protein [Sandaracinus sp.]MCB9635209.1 hypothetical protein [Sandaracinus sp.]